MTETEFLDRKLREISEKSLRGYSAEKMAIKSQATNDRALLGSLYNLIKEEFVN